MDRLCSFIRKYLHISKMFYHALHLQTQITHQIEAHVLWFPKVSIVRPTDFPNSKYAHICIYVYMYICIYVCVCMCVHVCTCVAACLCVCLDIYVCLFVCVFVYLFLCISVSVCLSVCVCLCTCVFVWPCAYRSACLRAIVPFKRYDYWNNMKFRTEMLGISMW